MMRLSSSFSRFASLAIVFSIAASMVPSAEAFWPFRHKPSPTAPVTEVTQHPKVQPTRPDETIPKEQCEPLRKEVVTLRQRQGWWFNPIDEVRIAKKTRAHRKCQDAFRDKEWEYLKHAEPYPNEPIFPKGM